MASHISYCCVDGCGTKVRDNVPFFRCPKDTTRCQQWKDALGFDGEHKYAKLTPKEAHSRVRVCSAHFDDKSFTSSRKRLLNTAVPSELLPKLADKKQKYDISSPSVKTEPYTETDIPQEFDEDKKQKYDISSPSRVLLSVKTEPYTKTDISQEFDEDNKQKYDISSPSKILLSVKTEPYTEADIPQEFDEATTSNGTLICDEETAATPQSDELVQTGFHNEFIKFILPDFITK